jgi:dephospho-CoA kinase
MLKVGLTGGYATGKSFVGSEFEKLGCHLILADQLGHRALAPGGAAYSPVVSQFGREILLPDGAIDRKKLASIVFNSPELLTRLNAIVHPVVFEMEEKMRADFAARDPRGVVILEAAILIETGRYKQCDKLVVTACDRETQIARGIKRDGVTRDAVVARLDKQLSLEEKKRYADFVIDTSGDKENTMKQVQEVYLALRPMAEATAR